MLAGDATAAYLLLRAFSWQLRLSPVAFEEFAAALFAHHPTPLMDEVRAQWCSGTAYYCVPEGSALAGVLRSTSL